METGLSSKKNLTIDDVKPKDRRNGYPLHVPRWYTKIFEFIPGLITWFFLFLPFIVAFAGYPEIMVIYVAFLTIYWAYRGLKFATGLVIGYKRMQRDVSTDWMKKIKDEGLAYDHLHYVLIFPIVREGEDVVERSIKGWAESDFGAKKLTIVFAHEERSSENSLKVVKKVMKNYEGVFGEVFHFVHPNSIKGEVTGVKNPNINWSTRLFVEELQKRGEKLSNYLLITCDSDSWPHPKYLSAVAYKYLTVYNQDRKFYATAVHTFNNNIQRVPILVRTFSHFLTLAILHEWVLRKKVRETWSAYIVNLQTVVDVEYWDPQITNDDTAFYYNALIRFKGDFSGEEVYIPTYNDAVENEDIKKTHISLYKQQLRWGWGSIVFPMTFAGLYKNSEIPPKTKLKIAMTMFDDRLIFRTVVYLITFGLPILTLISPEFQYSSASYNLPRIMSGVLTFILIFNIPLYVIKNKLSPIPKDSSIWKKVLNVVEIILVTVNLLTFAFIPYLHALTEMMFRKEVRRDYYATEKVAIKK